jgi:hypothetical protein
LSEALVEQLPSEEADDPDGDGVFVAERVANRAHPLTHPQLRRLAERRDRQAALAVHLDQGDVGVRIGADDAGAQRAAVGQFDDDPFGAVDDVVVGQDAAVGVDDEAAAGAAPRDVAAVGARSASRDRRTASPAHPVSRRVHAADAHRARARWRRC